MAYGLIVCWRSVSVYTSAFVSFVPSIDWSSESIDFCNKKRSPTQLRLCFTTITLYLSHTFHQCRIFIKWIKLIHSESRRRFICKGKREWTPIRRISTKKERKKEKEININYFLRLFDQSKRKRKRQKTMKFITQFIYSQSESNGIVHW